MKKFSTRLSKGQTAVEYLLMMSLAVGLGITLFKKLNEYLIQNPNGMIATPLNQFRQMLNSDESGRYRRFPIKLPR